MFEELQFPVIAAPMAGGPSTPELVAAMSEAGGFAFLAAGYLKANELAEQIRRTRTMTKKPFGVNLFVPGQESTVDISDYADVLAGEAHYFGVEPGIFRWDDDSYSEKLEVVIAEQISVISFTFGLPTAEAVRQIHTVGSTVVVTVTSPAEAREAAELGVDALCVQAFEAGGHRAIFTDDPAQPAGGELYGLLSALRLISATTDLPLIAAGGLVHGADIAAVLVAGASAAQLGTAFLLVDEAGTDETFRQALKQGRPTAITRAFSGRPARGLVNRFMTEHSAEAPAAYPEVHHLSKPIRAAASQAGDPEAMSLWAGQTSALAQTGSAAQIVAKLRAEAEIALNRIRSRFNKFD